MGGLGGWASIMHATWEDEEFMELSPEGKILFLWGFTHDKRASMTGITVVSERRMRNILWCSQQDLEKTLGELGSKPFMKYDFDHEVLWVVKRAEYAHSKSPFWLKGLRSHVDTLPTRSPLVAEYRRFYAYLLDDAKE